MGADEFRRRWQQLSESCAHVSRLSPRTTQAVVGVALGFTDKEIADALFVTESTVRCHIRRFWEEVLDPNGLPRKRTTITAWVWAHASCCATQIVAHLESGS
jgi:FixJ family two-component response regulator